MPTDTVLDVITSYLEKDGGVNIELSEKYRPKTLDDVKGQDDIVDAIKSKDYLKNYMFIGPAGCGKTTIAQILADRYDVPLVEKNASDERGIDFVRNDIKRYVKTRGKRILLLDEADALTPEAQNALRRLMESPNSESYFILTGNDGWRLIEPIKSRCSVFEFKRIKDEVILRRILEICKAEGFTIDSEAKEGLIQILKQANGDMRKAINTLEKVVNKEGKITAKTVMSFVKPKTATQSLHKALEGDWEKAKELMENAFIENRYSPIDITKELYESIANIEAKEEKKKLFKILLHKELAHTERALKTECDPILPLIQLVGFISYAWLLPHLPESALLKDLR